jgi:hypothetical protein
VGVVDGAFDEVSELLGLPVGHLQGGVDQPYEVVPPL